jgi:hypothetical protein
MTGVAPIIVVGSVAAGVSAMNDLFRPLGDISYFAAFVLSHG